MNDRKISDIIPFARIDHSARVAAGKWNRERTADPGHSAADLLKLIEITGAPAIITDAALCILSMSSSAGDLFDISQACTGTALSGISNIPDLGELIQDARLVLGGHQTFIERSIGKLAGETLYSRMLPYHGPGGQIAGVMVAWVSIAPLLLSGISPPVAGKISLESQLLSAKEEERRRIAHILHDDLQQLLCSVLLKLSLQESTQMTDVKAALGQAINLARTLSRDLNQNMLKNRELIDMLKWLIDNMENQFGMSVDITCLPDCRIECEQSRVLVYQAIRELLFNVVKHSGTRSATVKLKRQDDRLHIDVIDYGRGMGDLPYKVESQGLSVIREQLILLGGEMRVNSGKKKGTAVQIQIPCQG